MHATKKVTGRARSMPGGLTVGALTSLGITLILAVIGGKLVDMGTLREGTIGYIAMVTLLIASFCGALAAAGSIKRQKLMVCGLSALIYYAVLLGMTALFFGGQYRGMGVTALLVLCGCAVAALTVTRQGRGGHRNVRHKVVHR